MGNSITNCTGATTIDGAFLGCSSIFVDDEKIIRE
jgi:hypothetical protein